ncbi:cysteine desulfurase family protein [Microvirga antarctica]|uniref:cysteine desulfurase family protein n=1 Tax=Microvirga antarctica TaxID=2819233 RepID=UPI001B317086|nr:cysteine desulfurase family protein [Microvirga antarctica]
MALNGRVYLDHNATSPVRPEVQAAVARALTLSGNPSSVHAEGRAARAAIETARDQVARLVGAKAKNVIFTSGGTEAANMVLSPSFRRLGDGRTARLVLLSTEHPCGLNGHRFDLSEVALAPCGHDGVIDLDWLEVYLGKSGEGRTLVSVQWANNETGIVQPVAAVSALVRHYQGLLHVDAVQAAGRLAIDLPQTGADALTLSAHKIAGPKGVGAVILGTDQLEIADRLIRGGGQERGARAGTENVPAIVGFGEAASLAAASLESEAARLLALRMEAEERLRAVAPSAIIIAEQSERLPNTFAFAIPGLKAETALIAFDLQGIALSSGSACSSGKVKRSHVLDAMGVDPVLADGVLRVSLGWTTTHEDVVRFAETCERVTGTLYKRKADAA